MNKKATQQLILAQDPALVFRPQNLQVKTINVVKHEGHGVDFLAEVLNPSPSWQAMSFDYNFAVLGNPLQVRSSFALPGEKYLAGFSAQQVASREVSLDINNIVWRKIKTKAEKERLGLLNFETQEVEFKAGDKKEIVDTVRVKLKNNSPFSFWKVGIIAVVYKDGQIAAVGQGQLENFTSAGIAETEIGLGILKVNQVDQIKIFPDVNILDQESIM